MINYFKCKICKKYSFLYKLSKLGKSTFFGCKKCETVYSIHKNVITNILYVIDDNILYCDTTNNYNFIIKNILDKPFMCNYSFNNKIWFYESYCLNLNILSISIGNIIAKVLSENDLKLKYKQIICVNEAKSYLEKHIRYQSIY